MHSQSCTCRAQRAIPHVPNAELRWAVHECARERAYRFRKTASEKGLQWLPRAASVHDVPAKALGAVWSC